MSTLTYRVGALSAILLVAACAFGGPVETGDRSSETPAASSSSPVLRTSVEQECGTAAPPDVEITEVTVRTADGVRLRTAILGSGVRGITMLHQTDDGLCGWFGYAGYLATQGFQVAIFDRRCTFGSSCVDEPAAYDFIADVEAVTSTLRGRGAADTAVIGASFGGAIAIGACAEVDVSACVALSPALFDNYLGNGITANNAINRIRFPLLVAVAPDDPDSPQAAVTALTRRAPSRLITSVTLPVGGAHGWDTVIDASRPGQQTPFSTRLVAFLNEELPRQ